MANIIQFTGLSGAGKTTIALEAQRILSADYRVAVIDGDVYRQLICSDLGFSKADRIENISRLGAVALSMRADFEVIIIAAINPFNQSRKLLQRNCGARLVHIDCDLATLRERDTKGLYHRANLPDGDAQKINNLTGVNDVFEWPHFADLRIFTGGETLEKSMEKLLVFIKSTL